MKLENIKRSITIEGYKFMPKAINGCHLVYIGTAEECEAYAEKLDRENNTDCAFVGCLGDYEIKNTGLVFHGPWLTIKALKNVYFVQYWA